MREGDSGTVTAPRPIPKPTPPMRPRFRLKDTSVILNPFVQTRLEALANAFYEKTGKELVITDGFRTPEIQAERMYNGAAANTLTQTYRQSSAAKEIQDAYNNAAAKQLSRMERLAEMAKVIANQIAVGTYISDHLRNNAADVRSKEWTSEEKRIFREIAMLYTGKILFEAVGKDNEHWHLEF